MYGNMRLTLKESQKNGAQRHAGSPGRKEGHMKKRFEKLLEKAAQTEDFQVAYTL